MQRVGTFCAVFCLALAALSIDTSGALATTNTITTSVGNGTAGYNGDGGQAVQAELSTPAGVTIGPAGNLFVADDGDNVVRKVTPGGVITTVAGTGVAGYTGNGHAATAATLHGPTDVVLDSAGNLYIADAGNHVVRKVTPAGVISTIAGNGTSGYAGDNGLATKAKLVTPVGLDIDTAGNLFIADYGNGTVRKVTTAGTITTVAGNGTVGYSGDGGPANQAELSHPGDVVAVGSVLYIADGGNSRVREVSGGVITTIAGDGTFASTGDGGQATAASLMFPTGLAADSAGDLFVSDFYGENIRKIAVGGIISTVAGTGVAGYAGDTGDAVSAQLNGPARVNLDAAGDLYISDWNNHVVRTVSTLGSAAAPPGSPTAVTATAGNATADVSWSAPSSDGNSPITHYSVIPNDGVSNLAPIVVSGGTTSTTVTGLTNGNAYTFTITATNAAGDSLPSAASAPVTPTTPPPSATVPDAPTAVGATGGDSSASVSWTAPVNDGGSPVTSYTVTPNDGTNNLTPTTVTGGATSTTVNGLADGSTYTFTVVATNGVGDSVASAASSAVTPSTVPDPPSGVSATAGDTSADLSWTAPVNDGGAAITGYSVIPNDGTADLTPIAIGPGSTSTTVTGLTNGTTYTFTVEASNATGTGAPSASSSPVTPTAPPPPPPTTTAPDAPTAVTATAHNASADVSWTAPANDGGSAITGYTVTPNDGTNSLTPVPVSSGTSTTVNGLTNGTAYTFTVTATNGVGTSPASAASNSVTPTAPPPPPPPPSAPGAPTAVTATAHDASADVSWTAPASNGGAAITGYTVTPNDGTNSLAPVPVSSGTSTTVNGLTNGTAYTFTVTATNSAGTSSPSTPSSAVTPTAPPPPPPPPPAATAPDAPTGVSATAGDGRVNVTWSAPANDGGAAVTGYSVTPNDGTSDLAPVQVSSGTSTTVSGLTNGTSYTFTVTATNAVGSSSPSAPSSAVTPTAASPSPSATPTPTPTQSSAPASPKPTPTPSATHTSSPSGAGQQTTPPSSPDNTATTAPSTPAVAPTAPAPTLPLGGTTTAVVTEAHQRHHRDHHQVRHAVRIPAALTRGVPEAVPAAPPVQVHHHHHGLTLTWHNVRAVVVAASKKTAVPAALLLMIVLFLSLQNRLDRRDPKLALAPVYADPGVSFVPAMS